MPAAWQPVRATTVRLLVVLLVFFPTFTFAPRAGAQEVGPDLEIGAKYYIVVDADTGQIFAARGADKKVAIASLTKIFTAIEAIEMASPDTTMTTDQSDVFDDSSTRMGFGAGETFTFRDLLYGMLLPSGNDAAHAIARNLGLKLQPHDNDQQAVDYFVSLMNQRNKDMGLTETHLVNPHGWGVPGHYSSAHDLATFMLYALKYPRFVQAISTPEYVTPDGNYDVVTTNKLLGNYDGLIGGKTGYDDDAGYCLIEVAKRDGHTMISVTLNAQPDTYYDDATTLLDYAFQQNSARLDANKPVTGEVVSYKDPDAAAIARDASAGGSLGKAAETGPTKSEQPADHQSETKQQASDPPPAGSSGNERFDASPGAGLRQRLDWHFFVVVLVAVLIILAGSANAIRQRGRDHRKSGSIESPPTSDRTADVSSSS